MSLASIPSPALHFRGDGPPRSSTPFSAAWTIVAAAAFAVGLLYQFWPVFRSGLALVPGDLGDARFIQALLEHWFQVVKGNAAWRDPPFFHPAPGVLGYSDGLFFYAIPYILLRLARLGPVTAYFATLCVIFAIGYASALWFLRRIVGLGAGIAIVAALTWVFSNIAQLKGMHVNLYAVGFVPIALGLGWRFVAALAEGRGFNRAGVALAIFIPLLLYTSYYMGWFAVFLLLLWGGAFGLQQLACRRQQARDFIARAWTARTGLAALGVVFALALVPFFMTYVPVYRTQTGRLWVEVVTLLPTIADFVNVGTTNVVWGGLGEAIARSGREIGNELVLGFPPGLIVVFLFVLALYTARMARACRTKDADFTTVDTAITCFALLVPLCWLAMLRVGDSSLWAVIYSLVPGASAVRAVFRLQMILHLVMLALIGLALERAWRTPGRRPLVWAVLALLVVEQLNFGRVVYDARADAVRAAAIGAPPAACRFFAIAPGGTPPQRDHPTVLQIDAMEVARRFRIPTINGYSSLIPPHWSDALWTPYRPGYAAALDDWLRRHHLDDGFCTLDFRDGLWWTPLPDDRSLAGRNLVSEPRASMEDVLSLRLYGFHDLETIGRWTDGLAEVVPAHPIAGSRLTIAGQVINPKGTRLVLGVNGRQVLDQALGQGPYRFEIPLDEPLARLRIGSTVFVPKDEGHSADTRRLGIVVERLTVE